MASLYEQLEITKIPALARLDMQFCAIVSRRQLILKGWLPDMDSNHDSECSFVSVTYRFYTPTISKKSAWSCFLYGFCTVTYAGDDDR